jgi:septum formation protein
MKLILGSKSPRRSELLSQLGFKFEIRTKTTDETFPSHLKSDQVALFIAEQKAAELLNDLKKDEVLLCADTIVVIDDLILGKPSGRDDAIQMLENLSGRNHTVITGVVIASKEKNVSFSVTTHVVFQPLSGEEIRFYIDTFKPYDKAGAYGIQEWIGYTGIQRIDGSYNNVVGLPTHEVYQALKNFQ